MFNIKLSFSSTAYFIEHELDFTLAFSNRSEKHLPNPDDLTSVSFHLCGVNVICDVIITKFFCFLLTMDPPGIEPGSLPCKGSILSHWTMGPEGH